MELFLEILAGDGSGERFRLFPGQTLGRKRADIALKDHKVSSIHARIELQGPNLVLIDLKSRNGLVRDGQRLPQIILTPGAQFIVGNTLLQVSAASADSENAAPLASWQEGLRGLNRQLARHSQPLSLTPFSPGLELHFTAGAQKGQRWTLGYGPRHIGTGTAEFLLSESAAPSACFSIEPSAEGACFVTDQPQTVQLNDAQITRQVLRTGDQIRIQQTVIQVKLLDV